MINSILGKKIKQTRIFTEDGQQIPVTEVTVGPCMVVQVKTIESDGYDAIQLGFDQKPARIINKPTKGHLRKTGQGNLLPRFLHEVKVDYSSVKTIPLKIGDQMTVDKVLQVGDIVKVTGISKAKGFAGVVKRHGFAGGPRTRGQSDRERAPGSIGQSTTPGRVYKGKRMAGHMGGKTSTIKGLKVVKLDQKNNRIWIKGLVPGNIGAYLTVQKQDK